MTQEDQTVEVTTEQPATAEVTPSNTEDTGTTDPKQEQAQETDEQKNERVQREAQDRAKRRQQGVQKRIDELTADKYAERAARERVERELAQLRQEREREAKQATGAPKREQFDSYEEFLRAEAVHAAKQVAAQEVAQARQQAEEQARQRSESERVRSEADQFRKRQAEFIKATPDYMDVMEAAGDMELPEGVYKTLRVIPEGPAVAYALAKNPALMEQFQDAPADMHGVLIGKIVASLGSPAKGSISKAPPPGTPVRSRPGSSSEPPTNPDEYQVWAAKHMR